MRQEARMAGFGEDFFEEVTEQMLKGVERTSAKYDRMLAKVVLYFEEIQAISGPGSDKTIQHLPEGNLLRPGNPYPCEICRRREEILRSHVEEERYIIMPFCGINCALFKVYQGWTSHFSSPRLLDKSALWFGTG